MRTFLSTTALAVIATTFLAGPASAETANPFRCEPGEKYVMNVMVSGVEYWFPVYEMFKQAGQQFGVRDANIPAPRNTTSTSRSPLSIRRWRRTRPASLLHPMNSDPFIEPINRAIDHGHPRSSPSPPTRRISKRISFITSDNTREGV